MKKRLIGFILVVALGSVLVSCNNSEQEGMKENNNSVSQDSKAIVVDLSNLNDLKEQEEVKQLLLKAGINEVNVDKYIEYIKDYNERIDVNMLKKGEISTKDLYDGISPTIKLLESGRPVSELNCRVSAYELFKDFITTEANLTADNYLMFDLDTIDNNSVVSYTEDERTEFINFFNPINIGDVTEPKEIIKLIQGELEERNVKIDGNGDVSLINVFINDEFEKKMFVGHSAVMVKDGEDYILLEKYSATAPFQLSKFSSEEEVKEYLLSRKDIYGSEIKPIILKNNEEF